MIHMGSISTSRRSSFIKPNENIMHCSRLSLSLLSLHLLPVVRSRVFGSLLYMRVEYAYKVSEGIRKDHCQPAGE